MSQYSSSAKTWSAFEWKGRSEPSGWTKKLHVMPALVESYVHMAGQRSDAALQQAKPKDEATIVAFTWGGSETSYAWERRDAFGAVLKGVVPSSESRRQFDLTELFGQSLDHWRLERGNVVSEQKAVDGLTTILGQALRLMSEGDEQRLALRVIADKGLDVGATLSALLMGRRAGVASKSFGATMVATLAARDAEQARRLFVLLFPHGDSAAMSALARAALQAELTGVESTIERALHQEDLPDWLREDLQGILEDIRG